MRTRRLLSGTLLLALLLVGSGAGAQLAGYRWVDDQGNVHYAGRRDQVPEQYRSQLSPEGPSEPPKPRLPEPPGASARVPEPGECVLRFRGTAARPASSRSYPSCEACWKALAQLQRGEATRDEASRAECIASSVKSYR
jgi:Domain of unknown function (DUF4124)